MENVIDWKEINQKSIYEQLKEQLEMKKDSLDSKDYDMNYEKLKNLLISEEKINKQNDEELKKRYRHILVKLTNPPEKMNEFEIMSMILSFSTLVACNSKIFEKSDEEIRMLSFAFSRIEEDEYSEYLPVLGDLSVVSEIVKKSDRIDDQVNMAYDVMYISDFYTADLLEENCDKIIIGESIEKIKDYKLPRPRRDADVELVCSDCGESFIMPAYIKISDITDNTPYEKAVELFLYREMLKEKIIDLYSIGKVDEAEQLELDLYQTQRIIVELSNNNSKEAHKYHGTLNMPKICPECKMKTKESNRKR